MATEINSYEEARRLRVQENLKHLEGLGISKVSKSLLEVVKCESKLLKCYASPKSKENLRMIELRRSTRARNVVSSYHDGDVDIDFRPFRRRCSRSGSSARAYNGRIASYEEQVRAREKAEKLQDDLKSNHPSFVKPMVRSHVSSCFWLGLPSKFCKDHLPARELKMVLEDETGLEYDAIYIGSRTGLSGGWRGFAMDRSLEEGDVLVFELTKPDRFKVYIIKALEEQPCQESNEDISDTDIEGTVQPPRKMTRSMEEKEEELPVSEKSLTRRSKRLANGSST